jgi:hypothetical protein
LCNFPQNFKFTFTDDVNYAWGSPSNMWCYKCKDCPNDPACHNDKETKSFCLTANSAWDNQEYSRNFFNKECPNLVSEGIKIGGEAKGIKAKQAEPLILVDHSKGGKIIDREGNDTGQYYNTCKQYINVEKKDNCPDSTCNDCFNAIKDSKWYSDKVVILQIPTLKEAANFYSSNDYMETQDSTTSCTPIDYLSVV